MSFRFDVTSVGSTMIRLSVPPGERLETASAYEVRSAGAESNTLGAIARMGKRVAWVSRLADNPLGRRIAGDLRYLDIDVSRVAWSAEGRNELYFLEPGAGPRAAQVVYDRKHSAFASITPGDIDLDFLLNARIVHLTGITPALSEKCAATVDFVLRAANDRGVEVSFDLNYREKLWSPEEARRVLTPMVKLANVFIITKEDARRVFGIDGTPEEVVDGCRELSEASLCVVTLGDGGGIAFDGTCYHCCAGYPVEVHNRPGAGDAFTAGLLTGYLEGSVQTGMDYASAMAAIKLGIRGDCFIASRGEVESLIDSGGDPGISR